MSISVVDRLGSGIVTASADETRRVAAELAGALPPDSTVALHGDLGVGKTTFVQGLAAGLGIFGTISSPTYTVYTIHRGPRGILVHLDAYRIENPAQIDALMLEDFLISPYTLAIEWPERIAPIVPKNALSLVLGITADNRHTIRTK